MTGLGRLDSLGELAKSLDLSDAYLEDLLRAGDDAYHRYESRALGREIDEPCPRLMAVQRVLLRKVAPLVRPHSVAHGGVAGRSPLSNARVHFPSNQVSKLDIRRFFPSVTIGMVRHAFQQAGASNEVLPALVRLTTFEDGLPTGAPTSPWVGNLVLRPLDISLGRFCGRIGAHYSRYIDDLTLSGPSSETAYWKARSLVAGLGFDCSPTKCVAKCHPGKPIVVTGYVVNGHELKPPRAYRRRVSNMVYRLIREHTSGRGVRPGEVAIVQGHLAYMHETCLGEAEMHTAALISAGIALLSLSAEQYSV